MTDSEELTPFAIFGLYRDRMVPQVILATDKAHARAQYHQQHPGLEGTTLAVKSLDELTENEND